MNASAKDYDGIYTLFRGDCDGLIKRIVKEDEKEVTLEIPIRGVNPSSFDKEREEADKEAFYNALTKSECLAEINLYVDLKDE